MDSIIQNSRECIRCGATENLDVHHCLEGAYRGNRKNLYGSEKYGLTIYLCRRCHQDVHADERKMQYYRELAEEKALEFYGWTVEDFIRKIGRNFL